MRWASTKPACVSSASKSTRKIQEAALWSRPLAQGGGRRAGQVPSADRTQAVAGSISLRSTARTAHQVAWD
jgi:hypothetical protein